MSLKTKLVGQVSYLLTKQALDVNEKKYEKASAAKRSKKELKAHLENVKKYQPQIDEIKGGQEAQEFLALYNRACTWLSADNYRHLLKKVLKKDKGVFEELSLALEGLKNNYVDGDADPTLIKKLLGISSKDLEKAKDDWARNYETVCNDVVVYGNNKEYVRINYAELIVEPELKTAFDFLLTTIKNNEEKSKKTKKRK